MMMCLLQAVFLINNGDDADDDDDDDVPGVGCVPVADWPGGYHHPAACGPGSGVPSLHQTGTRDMSLAVWHP